MSLRARILIVTVALFVVGLGAANFATYYFLSSFLVDRVDDQLEAATDPVAAELTRTAPRHGGEPAEDAITRLREQHGLSLPDGSYAALVDGGGRA